jgi:hypothetical protein
MTMSGGVVMVALKMVGFGLGLGAGNLVVKLDLAGTSRSD